MTQGLVTVQCDGCSRYHCTCVDVSAAVARRENFRFPCSCCTIWRLSITLVYCCFVLGLLLSLSIIACLHNVILLKATRCRVCRDYFVIARACSCPAVELALSSVGCLQINLIVRTCVCRTSNFATLSRRYQETRERQTHTQAGHLKFIIA